jgi:hypothetical protein
MFTGVAVELGLSLTVKTLLYCIHVEGCMGLSKHNLQKVIEYKLDTVLYYIIIQ